MLSCTRRHVLGWLGSSMVVACSNDGTVALNGAGATFPYPLYTKWIDEYRGVSPNVRINYQSIGSGGGVRQIVAGTVDFGASDVPAEPDEERGATGPIVHVPTAVGCVVVSYNLPELTTPLRLTPELLSAIYLGAITRWNDRALALVNPGAALPDLPITVVFRTDGSGTTAIFTRFLAASSPGWRERAGAGKNVRFAVGLGAKGNEGVSGQLQATPGSIGYTELAYATQGGLPRAAIRNRAGEFVAPSAAAALSAADTVELPVTLQATLEGATNPQAYPLAAYTYLLVYEHAVDARRGEALAQFIWWGVHEGQRFAPALDYAPLPARAVLEVEKTLRKLRAGGKPALAI
ncbi:MAG TPA: phosphate ABC transporter substrate-binding protein PstS [Polyangiaceae bacterium]|nr:phosphate ABC transporter substrate-binding protein PstS [Polyangiaceae bacterium]